MGFAVSFVARGGKIVVSGLMGGNFSLPMVQWIYKRMTIEGFMTGTLAEAHELMALARAGKIKPTPMREKPMGDVQKWIDELARRPSRRPDRADQLTRENAGQFRAGFSGPEIRTSDVRIANRKFAYFVPFAAPSDAPERWRPFLGKTIAAPARIKPDHLRICDPLPP